MGSDTFIDAVVASHSHEKTWVAWVNSRETILVVAFLNLASAIWSLFIEADIYKRTAQNMEPYTSTTTTTMSLGWWLKQMEMFTTTVATTTTMSTTQLGTAAKNITELDLYNLYKTNYGMSQINILLFSALVLLFSSVFVEYFSGASRRAKEVLKSFRNELRVHSRDENLAGVYVPDTDNPDKSTLWTKKDAKAKFKFKDGFWELFLGENENIPIAQKKQINFFKNDTPRADPGIPPSGKWDVAEHKSEELEELRVVSCDATLAGVYVRKGADWTKKCDGQTANFKYEATSKKWKLYRCDPCCGEPIKELEGDPDCPPDTWRIEENSDSAKTLKIAVARRKRSGTIIVKSERSFAVLDDTCRCLMDCVRRGKTAWFVVYLLAGFLSLLWPLSAYEFSSSGQFDEVVMNGDWSFMNGVGMGAIIVSLFACLGSTMSRPTLLTRELISSLKLYLHNEHLRIDVAMHAQGGNEDDLTDVDPVLKHMVWKRFSVVMMHIMSLWSPAASAPWCVLIASSGSIGVAGFALLIHIYLSTQHFELFLLLMTVFGFGLVALLMWRVIWLNQQLTSKRFESDSVFRIAHGANMLSPSWDQFVAEMETQLELNHIQIFLVSANWPALANHLKRLVASAGGLSGAWTLLDNYMQRHKVV